MATMLPLGVAGPLPTMWVSDASNVGSMKRGFDMGPGNLLTMQFPHTIGKGRDIAGPIDANGDPEVSEAEINAWKKEKRRKQNRDAQRRRRDRLSHGQQADTLGAPRKSAYKAAREFSPEWASSGMQRQQGPANMMQHQMHHTLVPPFPQPARAARAARATLPPRPEPPRPPRPSHGSR
ncbi:hypothetical protein T484DRAFT_1751349 [Baffinella frigidus]|nr:hypothetical protein T484DRAFT_1751349 [Cryptophyta sp. CCMP2293]